MDFLFFEFASKPLWMWFVFLTAVISLIAFDLGVLHRKCHEIGIRESLWLSAFYISGGLLFALWTWIFIGDRAAIDYLTGFVVEKSLALDNVFVIAMIFSYFAIPRQYQHRVLLYGILGVVVLRALMLGAGVVMVARFEWILYLFAGFLIITGVRMLVAGQEIQDIGRSPILAFVARHFRVTHNLHGERFVVHVPDQKTGRPVRHVTPLLVALVMVEVSDVIFAVDSVPVILTITTDPFVVYTSNIFAILGLRALYFALAAMLHRFAYLKYALSLVLIFIGGKIFVADMLGLAKIPPTVSLTVTLALLGAGILVSFWKTRSGSVPIVDTGLPERQDH